MGPINCAPNPHVHVNIKVHFQASIDKIYDSVIILTKKLTYLMTV